MELTDSQKRRALEGIDLYHARYFLEVKSRAKAKSDIDYAAKVCIFEGGLGISKAIVSSLCLTKALSKMTPPVNLRTNNVSELLCRLGFFPVSGSPKWKGQAHRLWVTGDYKNAGNRTYREMLDQTVPGVGGGGKI